MPVNFWPLFQMKLSLAFFLEDKRLELISCLFGFLLHILATCVDSSSRKVITFPDTICWAVICVLTSHSPHSAAAPNTWKRTWKVSTRSSYCQSRDCFTGLLSCIRFQQLTPSDRKLSRQHPHLLNPITLHFPGFLLISPPCLPFNVTCRAQPGFFPSSHSASHVPFHINIINCIFLFSPVLSPECHSRQWVSLSLDTLLDITIIL